MSPIVDLPFRPRLLSLRERKSKDTYSFLSPKLDRIVEVVEPSRAQMAIEFEFDPAVLDFAERPRRLSVGQRDVELDFFTLERNGRERFWLFVPNAECYEPGSPRRVHRESTALVDAANNAHLALEFTFEADLIKRRSRFNQSLHLLPYAQDAMFLENRESLKEQLRTGLQALQRASIDQLWTLLAGFHRADVTAAIANLVHGGELIIVGGRALDRLSVVERRADHASA
ncbi:hypothetical protein [Luteimonas fraxinea]|uniref:hypothetical protein n=1 Tax=Luteimonas fraxinea TaxID=2901869 RepID=UPI001E51B4BC|nr:hypothetical protein [Luteimonas fraxinea]MCD9127676.1 hypothetical protein [Luteimonas fraxinea]